MHNAMGHIGLPIIQKVVIIAPNLVYSIRAHGHFVI